MIWLMIQQDHLGYAGNRLYRSKNKSRDNGQEVIALIQVGDDSDSDQNGGGGGGEETESLYVFKIHSGFSTDQLKMC